MAKRFDFGGKPHLGYTQGTIERDAALRHDAAQMAAFASDPRARILVIGGEFVVLMKTGAGYESAIDPALVAALAPVRERVFLGRRDGAPLFAAAIEAQDAAALKSRDDLLVMDLRSIAVGGLVAAECLPALAEAKALLSWHARHRFCGCCGSATEAVESGWRRDCPSCGSQHFPRTDPVVIMLAIDRDRCLLGRQARFAKGMWSCLAGFMEPGETIEEAVRRETVEETGIVCGRVAYFASQPWPFPMSLMIGCHAEALTAEIMVDRSELEDARWFERDEVAAMLLQRHAGGYRLTPPMAIAHHIIRAWLEADGNPFDRPASPLTRS